jgi:hypothetical protein
MNSLVCSIPLRIFYLLAGGLPSLVLAVLCLNFGQATVWAISHTNGSEQIEAVMVTLVFTFGILGTVSGWLAFFAVGTSSVIGRAVHSFFISGGVVAAALFEWQTLQIKGVSLSASLPIIGPAVVGCCLLYHLWQGPTRRSSGTALKRSPLT